MASRTITRLPFLSSRACFPLSSASRRPFTTSRAGLRLLPLAQTTTSKSILQQTFRRSYAEAVVVTPPPPPPSATAPPLPPPPPAAPPPKPKRRFRFFRWVWRLTYLSVLGGIGWLAWNIYSLRNPADQFEPDPTKKNLVILGMCVARSLGLN
jgi:NADH:ubiquinone reductase (non-electrogenic)